MPALINYTCPHCSAALGIPAQYAGKPGRCKHCNNAITVPPLEWKDAAPSGNITEQHAGPDQPTPLGAASAPHSKTAKWIAVASTCVAVLGIPFAYHLGHSRAQDELRANPFAAFAQATLPTAYPQGPKPASAEPPSRTVHAVGEEVSQAGLTMIVHSAGPYTGTGQFASTPSPGNIFIAFDVSITNNTDQDFTANGAAFCVKDGSGREYRRPAFAGPEPRLPLSRLYTGETARGWTTLEIPAELPTATLTYQLNVVTGEDIRFRLW